MKRVCLLAALAAVAVAWAVENQAYVALWAETRVTKMPGMPKIELPPGVDPGMLANMPGMAQVLAMGKPQRTLRVRLWSPNVAPENASAHVLVPAGLKLGPRLDLQLERPRTGGEAGPGEPGQPGGDPQMRRFTIKRYWGSSETVKAGQPEVTTWGDLTAEQRAAAEAQMRAAQQQGEGGLGAGFRAGWTTGIWPTPKQPGQIAPDAKLAGHYAVNTTYTGSVEFDVPANVNFLDGIEFTSPSFEEAIPLDDAIHFEWRPIANCLGFHARITGMIGEDTMIIWSSTETGEDPPYGEGGFLQMAEVRECVAKNTMMAGDRTQVIVPAGIFKDCDFVMMTMDGWGTGTALDEAQPLPRVQTRTSFSANLGGKKMAEMMGGQDDDN